MHTKIRHGLRKMRHSVRQNNGRKLEINLSKSHEKKTDRALAGMTWLCLLEGLIIIICKANGLCVIN